MTRPMDNQGAQFCPKIEADQSFDAYMTPAGKEFKVNVSARNLVVSRIAAPTKTLSKTSSSLPFIGMVFRITTEKTWCASSFYLTVTSLSMRVAQNTAEFIAAHTKYY